jgi:hypothetical protein
MRGLLGIGGVIGLLGIACGLFSIVVPLPFIRTRLRGAVVLLVSVALLGFVGTLAQLLGVTARNAEPVAGTAARSEPLPWHEVRRWTGDSTKQTESFDIASSEWRIAWTTKSHVGGPGVFSIEAYSSSGERIAGVANLSREGSDISYVRSRPGRYYLSITNAAMEYVVRVEDQR